LHGLFVKRVVALGEDVTALRILLADDHEIVRRGLKDLLEAEAGWQIVGEAATGREAVAKAKLLKPDVAILDIRMPELNGLEATRQIRQALPRTEILILTMSDSEQLARTVLEAGAHGYLLKSDAGRDLVAAVDSLRQHRPFFTSEIARMVLQGFLKLGNSGVAGIPGDPLTGREREIIQLLAEGKSNKEVAAALGISLKTAETHRANIMRKLDLHSTSDLVHYAVRNGITTP
jgi:DNA-binding NarL/FixJ family response regulator